MPSGCDVGLPSSASRTSSWWASLKQTLPQGSPKSQEQSKARMRMSGGRCESECRRQVLVCAGHWRDDRAEQLVVGAKPTYFGQSESFRPGRRKNPVKRSKHISRIAEDVLRLPFAAWRPVLQAIGLTQPIEFKIPFSYASEDLSTGTTTHSQLRPTRGASAMSVEPTITFKAGLCDFDVSHHLIGE